MYLVDDEDLVLAHLRWYARLLHQRLDMLYAVVRRSIELEDVERALFIECLTTLTLSAGLTIGSGRQTVDGLGKDTCTGSLAHSSRSAKEVGNFANGIEKENEKSQADII